MRNLLRSSSLFFVGLLLTTTVMFTDVSADPAGATTLSSRPVTASGRPMAQRPASKKRVVKPRRKTNRSYRLRGTRSAIRSRAVRPRATRTRATRARPSRARAPRPRVVKPRPVQAKAAPAAPGDVWARLRQCESGGNYTINTGNGFYGAYQFHPRTWRGLGYPGLPHQAPPEVQDEAARKLQARSGWGQWPACSRRLGLR